ncbi:PLP-dependent aminotransferase family protein [Marinilactibacillus sp. Marseille-P9653]|uniref:aminotransferase-like domain-containing protein n=1 Tax=Marinilactibacillus sp. Marseille-P9653 TaxID=2866583 RepID=UPI001CE426F7|nr:PLP-dependent aminotransferase family protein [Marinilactibacillus sp. Marseille-P9653]
MENWSLPETKTKPLYQEIMLLIEEKIRSGQLAAGERLPAERKLAEALDVNRSTVIRAMEELTAQGVLTRKKGSGTFVNPDKWGLQMRPMINWGTALTTAHLKRTSPYQQAAERMKVQFPETVLDLSNGSLRSDLLPELHAPSLSWKELVEQEKAQLAVAHGIKSLRESVQRHLKRTYQIDVPLEEILITSGTQNALFLITQGLLKPGDTIGIEAPSYFYSLRLFQAAGLRIVPIKMDREGMTIKGLQEASLNHSLKMVFLNPIFQNPTGLVMSAKRKAEILDYCLLKRIPIVEDDAYGGLAFDEDMDYLPLKQLDTAQQVIYLGTMSKLAGHHLRVGWMVGPQAVLKELADIRLQIDSEVSFLPQFMADAFLRNELEDHLQFVRVELAKRARAMEDWLREQFGDTIAFEPARGGFHLYCRFPGRSKEEVEQLLMALLDQQIIVSEGEKFGDLTNGFRLSFIHFKLPH